MLNANRPHSLAVAILSATVLLAFTSSFSSATILTFNNLADWQAALVSSTLEDFESATVDDDFTDSPTTSPNGDLGLSAVEESTFSNNMLVDVTPFISGSDFNGSDAHVSLRFLDKSPDPDSVTVTFPAGTSAFALDFNNYDNQGDAVDLSFVGTNGGSLITISPIGDANVGPTTPNTGFFGLVDTGGGTVSSFTFEANSTLGTGASVFFSFDNIRYGEAIPEPTCLTLVGSLAIALLGTRRH